MDEISIVSWSSNHVGKSNSACLLRFRSMWRMNESKEAMARWKGQVEDLKMYPSYKEVVGIDGEKIEFEWNIFPGFSSMKILQEIQQDLERKNCLVKKERMMRFESRMQKS